MEKTIKITVERYFFDISNGLEAAAYSNLKADLRARGLKKFCAIANDFKEAEIEGVFTVNQEFLFDNQSNTKEGARVFDWFESYTTRTMNKNIRRGYYIFAGLKPLQEARENRLICGFCGHQYDKEGAPTICNECLENPYLGPDNLHLLKLVPVSNGNQYRPPLTEEEAEKLNADFQRLQVKTKKVETEEKREKITADYNKALDIAEAEYLGYLWLLDHGVNTENCIFYSHSKTFCFGWRSALSPEIVAGLKKELTHFPFNVEYKEV